MTTTHRALLSAHRAAADQSGAPDNSPEALAAAVHMAVEYVEFDVHRTLDGEFVLHHDTTVDVGGHPRWIGGLSRAQIENALGRPLATYEETLRLLAAHDKRVHIDLKFTSPDGAYADPYATFEVAAAEIASEIMGAPENFILSSTSDTSVAALRTWADAESPGTLVGLVLGRDLVGLSVANALVRLSEVFPAVRVRRCGANLLVVHHVLADLGVLGWAYRRGLPVVIYTVDEAAMLDRFVADPRVWMVTSNHPGRAVVAP